MWKFVNFKKLSQTKRKFTRKRRTLEIKDSEVYPDEGHQMITFQVNEKFFVICVGGSSFKDTATWSTVNNLSIFIFTKTDTDFWLETIKTIRNFSGASLENLSGASISEIKIENSLAEFILYGGMDLRTHCPTNDLYIFSLDLKKFTCNLSLLPSNLPENLKLRNIPEQCGDMPTKRLGHTLTRVGNLKYLLIGGAERISENYPHVQQRGHTIKDENVYILDLNIYSWKKIHVGTCVARAFHSANLLSHNKLVLVGGLAGDAEAKRRLPVTNICILDLANIQVDQLTATTLKCTINGDTGNTLFYTILYM